MKNNLKHISIVIPVYKAENCLHELYKRLIASLEQITHDFEIILIEDCGGDNSWNIITELAQNDPRVKGMQLSRNFGQHHAITAGLDKCNAEWIVVMDCDLQDAPEEIVRLYNKAQEGFDIVRACRVQRKDSLVKRVPSKAFYKIFNFFADADYNAQIGNFRIISNKVLEQLVLMREQTRSFSIMVDWLGFPTANIDVKHSPRYEGNSSYTFYKLLKLAFNICIAYSDKPLKLLVILGFFISLFAFLYGSFVIVRILLYDSRFPGWSSLIVSLYFLSGIIIATLGILGVYIGKIFNETKKRPIYVVSKTTCEYK